MTLSLRTRLLSVGLSSCIALVGAGWNATASARDAKAAHGKAAPAKGKDAKASKGKQADKKVAKAAPHKPAAKKTAAGKAGAHKTGHRKEARGGDRAKPAAKPQAATAGQPLHTPAPRPVERTASALPMQAEAATAPTAPEPNPAASNFIGRFLAATVPIRVAPGVEANSEFAPSEAPSAPAPAAATPLAYAPGAAPTASDIEATKEAIALARKGRAAAAAEQQEQVRDLTARKLVEWMILRSENSGAGFARYADFARANPAWPSVGMIRRRAEAQLWNEKREPGAVFAFFSKQDPLSARGKFAMARAAVAQGDRSAAQEYVRDAWRNDDFGADLEADALSAFGGMLTRADHKARMDVRLYENDPEPALRAAKRLGETELSIAHARIAVNRKARNAGALLDAVPAAARGDMGYAFSRIQWLRREDKIAEAARLMLTASRDPAAVHDTDEWWIERRLIARKLLDEGQAQTAYRIARDAARPQKENLAVEQLFTAGWIALRFLNDPGTAAKHFQEIGQASRHPTSLARASYWLGRASEAAGHANEARSHYEAAARHSAAYYGQLARARLGQREISVRRPPALSTTQRASLRNVDLVRALDLLSLTDNRDLVITFVSDLGRVSDVGVLTLLGEIASQHNDARAMLVIGKTAIARGYMFDHYAFPNAGIPKFAAVGPAADRSVVFAIARQESAFNARAMSHARAMGLMQVTPATGRVIARKWGLAFNEKRLLNDPSYNATMGAAEIGNLVQDF
ncbi:MAG: lytic transglycosylase domain-containing protein, partial [Variibacter sp.]|nr:lytic transglycosylase domain-containing protein [Variibacter sp.]